uniref:MobA-like NTP transferase domain-containing protein n=1 Tax=viral metagenome TaxID=1070528 RepID=A0A6C0HZF7_9ZZZZ
MNVIISCAGLGTRFKERGFKTPKHLIQINHKTLIEHAIESLNIEGNYYFIVRDAENELKPILKTLKPSCTILEIDYVTEGPASSCFLVKDH